MLAIQDVLVMVQPAILGGSLWLIVWCVLLCYIFELNKKPKETQETLQITRQKIVNYTTKAVIAIVALLPMPILARIFELWVETAGNTEQSINLLKVVSNIALSAAVGGATTYVAYRQYQISRASWQTQERKEIDELIRKTMYGKR